MDAHDLGITSVDAILRVIKALGSHRYVGARKHLVHVLVLGEEIDRDIDLASRDERLWKEVTEADVISVLQKYWSDSDEAARTKDALVDRLEELELPLPSANAFDEDGEDEVHPILIDAGWELLPLRDLHPERHRGLIEYFDDPVLLESARFEEENAIPPVVHLQELPVIGPRELLFGSHGGEIAEALVVWCEGNATYHEYVLKGVRRAAKL